MNTIEFVNYLRRLDINLFIEGDHLRCNAPEGTLTPKLKSAISDRKTEIISFYNKRIFKLILLRSLLYPEQRTILFLSRLPNNVFGLSTNYSLTAPPIICRLACSLGVNSILPP